MNKNNIDRDHLKNNQVPFFNGYKPQFYFEPLRKHTKHTKYINNTNQKEKQNDN